MGNEEFQNQAMQKKQGQYQSLALSVQKNINTRKIR